MYNQIACKNVPLQYEEVQCLKLQKNFQNLLVTGGYAVLYDLKSVTVVDLHTHLSYDQDLSIPDVSVAHPGIIRFANQRQFIDYKIGQESLTEVNRYWRHARSHLYTSKDGAEVYFHPDDGEYVIYKDKKDELHLDRLNCASVGNMCFIHKKTDAVVYDEKQHQLRKLASIPCLHFFCYSPELCCLVSMSETNENLIWDIRNTNYPVRRLDINMRLGLREIVGEYIYYAGSDMSKFVHYSDHNLYVDRVSTDRWSSEVYSDMLGLHEVQIQLHKDDQYFYLHHYEYN